MTYAVRRPAALLLVAYVQSHPRASQRWSRNARRAALRRDRHARFRGIVGERLDSPYKAGRQPSWVKIINTDYSKKEALPLGR